MAKAIGADQELLSLLARHPCHLDRDQLEQPFGHSRLAEPKIRVEPPTMRISETASLLCF